MTISTPASKSQAITRVRYLERQLSDDRGRRRLGTDGSAPDRLMESINQLRRELGWLEIDVDGHWRWPLERPGLVLVRAA